MTLHEPKHVLLSQLEQLQRRSIAPTHGQIRRALRLDLAIARSHNQRTQIAERYYHVFGGQLERLQRSGIVPTLGEIYAALLLDLAIAQTDGKRAEIAEQYDKAFGAKRNGVITRPDYALWRREFGRENPTTISVAFPSTEDLLRAGLFANEFAVVWGALSLANALATSTRGEQLCVDGNHESLAVDLERAAFHQRLAPLKNAYAGCALHRLLTLGAVEKNRFKSQPNARSSTAHMLDYLDDIERLIREIDPDWLPGRAVSFDRLNGERQIGTLKVFDLKVRFDSFLFTVRGAVRSALDANEIGNPSAQQLLSRAAQFAFSSWRCSRSSRLYIRKLEDEGRNYRYDMQVAKANEMMALVRASQAAKDAGNLPVAAKLAFWALRTIPDDLLESKTMPDGALKKSEFAALGNQVSYDIRQFGYEPDKRFSRKKVSRFTESHETEIGKPSQPEEKSSSDNELKAVESLEAGGGAEENLASAECPLPETSKVDRSGGEIPKLRRSRLVLQGSVGQDFFKAQVLADQQISDDWKTILKTYPCNAKNPMDSIGRVIYDASRIEDEGLLRGAFRLCAFKYRLPASSAALIRRLEATKDDLLQLASLFAQATSAMPVGMDDGELRKWQTILRKAWHGLSPSERIYEEDILSLHEVLLGRGVAVLRASKHATQYAQQFFGERGDDEIRHLVDCDLSLLDDVRIGAQGSKLKAEFAQFARTMNTAVWVSVVSLTPKEWSVLMVGDNGRWYCDRLEFGSSVLEEAGQMSAAKGWGEAWFRVPWKPDGGLPKLARMIAEAVATNYPSARYIHLAVEPRLARLPWNDLFRPVWKESGLSPVIAIIPNFTWALVANRIDHERKVLLLAANEEALAGESATNDEANGALFREVREQLMASRPLLKGIYSSAAFVLARGAWNPDAKMAELAAPGGTIALAHDHDTDLLDLGNYRNVFAYACRAGHVAQHFLGDLGGIPGVCLSLKTRLLVAPVAEVSPQTVAILHKHLADAKGPREIGLRYLQAIQEDRGVAHFNLFGFANEPV